MVSVYFTSFSEWKLSELEELAVKEGKFGTFVEISSRNRYVNPKRTFFTFTANTWKKFTSNVHQLQKCGDQLRVTEKKMVTVTLFNNLLYRTFSVKLGKGSTFVNLNESAWGNLLKEMKEVSDMFSLGEFTPCQTCSSQMKFVKLIDGRLKQTQLTPDELVEVEKHNATVENQLGIRCGYCGAQHDGDCHCHYVNCRQCSPDCFCETCGCCMYYVYF